MDGNQTMRYGQGAPLINQPYTFLQYQNAVYIKLDDYINNEANPTAGFTGIKTDAASNTKIQWQFSNYSAATQNPVIIDDTTAVNYDIMYYISSMFTISKGGDLMITINMV